MLESQDAKLQELLLQREIEQFLFEEASLIDERRFKEWLGLLTEDIRVYVPIVRNVRYDQAELERTKEFKDTCWVDEGKETLTQRVQQIATGLHWAEEPRSRTTHLLTNIRLAEISPDLSDPREVQVRLNFMLYRNRGQVETDFLVGKRFDRVRKVDGAWKVARREVHLDQSVLLAKNLTTFF